MNEPSNAAQRSATEWTPVVPIENSSPRANHVRRSPNGEPIEHEKAASTAARHYRQHSNPPQSRQLSEVVGDQSNNEVSFLTSDAQTFDATMHTSPATDLSTSNSFVLPESEPVADGVNEPTRQLESSQFLIQRVWGAEFASFTMQQTLDYIAERILNRLPTHIITANLNFLMLCDQNKEVREVAERADCIVCDGMPIVLRSRINKSGKLPERVAGSDLIYRLSEQASQKKHRIYFMGGAEGVAEETALQLRKLYPNLEIAGVACPPFRQLTDAETADMISNIRESGANILLVAFGQPKGEQWIDQHLSELGGMVCIQLGASFDFVAGTARRAPLIWQRFYLEWLYRAFSDPRRLIPRYLQNAWFLLKAIRADVLAWASPENR